MAVQPKAILKPIATKPMIRAKEDFGVSNTNVKLPLPKTYKFRVAMWCEGCALDVKQALEGSKGKNLIPDITIVEYATFAGKKCVEKHSIISRASWYGEFPLPGPRSIVDYSIEYNTKRVTISSPLSLDEVYKILTKAGKEATLEDTGGAVSK